MRTACYPLRKIAPVLASLAEDMQQLRATLGQAMSKRDPHRVQLLRLRYGLEDGQEWSFPQLGSRFNMTARVAKGMVHQELNFLRRQRTEVLQQFVES